MMTYMLDDYFEARYAEVLEYLSFLEQVIADNREVIRAFKAMIDQDIIGAQPAG